MDFAPIVDFLPSLWAGFKTVFVILGAAVVIGTFVDSMIPDEKDGGFMKKILAIPLLGGFLSYLTRFSPFNFQK